MVGDLHKYVPDADLGCGKPGDLQWHLCVLAQIESSEVADYMSAAFGVTCETKSEAREYVNEHCKRSD